MYGTKMYCNRLYIYIKQDTETSVFKVPALCIHSSSLWLYSLLDLGRFFSFFIVYTVSRTPWTGDQPVARPLPTHRTQGQNKRIQTFMSPVGFEPMTLVFERGKTVHTLDRVAIVIGPLCIQ
jgi:hypothetical protein